MFTVLPNQPTYFGKTYTKLSMTRPKQGSKQLWQRFSFLHFPRYA